MELVLIDPNSDEWNYMWKWLEDHPINKDIPEPSVAINNNQAWQYVGSYQQKERILHTFRHRCHPYNNEVVTVSVKGSDTFSKDQINKKFTL